jgi:CRISPR-associated protein Csd1
MSLFKNLLDTYEKCKDAADIQNAVDGEPGEKKTFLPVFHTTFKSQICITVDCNGNFINATRDSKDIDIIIPCTEDSAGGRTSKAIAPHPFCDQLDYVSGLNEAKKEAYLIGLGKWEAQSLGESKTKLRAIHAYVKNGTMMSDLENKRLFKDSEYSGKESPDTEKIRKIGVRFAVEIKDSLTPNVWEDKGLRQSWIDYVYSGFNYNQEDIFDYFGGVRVGKIANKHPKNINSNTGNAKLLSCNDNDGYTFRGRFANKNEAVIIDYEQSQKMHQTLRWLINNCGYSVDTQTIVVWGVDSDTSPPMEPYKNSYDIFSDMGSIKTDVDKLSDAANAVYADYSKKMRSHFQGYGNTDKIKQHARKICIAVFDAAIEGRMGPTFYQEMPQNIYLESIVKWHEDTSYYLTAWIKEKDEKRKEKSHPLHYIGAPSYDDILFAVYGKAKGGKDDGYNKLKKKVRKQLLECMFGNFSFPKSMVDMAAVRASHPMSFTDSSGKFSPNDLDRSISITCALARKYYKQQKKEDITLALDEIRTDRDYLYGRLLAVADRLEQVAMYKADKSDIRATNAIRLMAAFAVKPFRTWGVLHQQIIPYINQLNGAEYYQSIIDNIKNLFVGKEYENNAPLSPLYLLGFSAQRREFKNKHNQERLEDGGNGNSEQD